jgi:hypothetical protein
LLNITLVMAGEAGTTIEVVQEVADVLVVMAEAQADTIIVQTNHLLH